MTRHLDTTHRTTLVLLALTATLSVAVSQAFLGLGLVLLVMRWTRGESPARTGLEGPALAFTLWNLSLRRLTAIESAGINNTMLIQIALLAWVFLGEAPGIMGLLGIATVSAGVYLTQRRARAGATNVAEEESSDRGSD